MLHRSRQPKVQIANAKQQVPPAALATAEAGRLQMLVQRAGHWRRALAGHLAQGLQ